MTQPPNELEAGNLAAREMFERDAFMSWLLLDDYPGDSIAATHLDTWRAACRWMREQAALASKPAAPTVEAKLQQCLKCGSEYWIDYSWNPAAPTAGKYALDFRGDDCNVADDRDVIGKAIQTWSWHQQRPTSVAEAAQVFNIEPREVVDIIEHFDSPYLLLMGPTDDYTKLMIEHDGE